MKDWKWQEDLTWHQNILRKEGLIKPDDLPAEIVKRSDIRSTPGKKTSLLRSSEAETILRALDRHDGKRIEAARELGIDRTTLWRKIKRYGL